MHGLHNMFYFERKKNIHAVFLLYLFVGIFTTMFFFFLSKFFNVFFFCCWKVVSYLAIVTKCSILDVTGVLNPLQYAPT